MYGILTQEQNLNKNPPMQGECNLHPHRVTLAEAHIIFQSSELLCLTECNETAKNEDSNVSNCSVFKACGTKPGTNVLGFV